MFALQHFPHSPCPHLNPLSGEAARFLHMSTPQPMPVLDGLTHIAPRIPRTNLTPKTQAKAKASKQRIFFLNSLNCVCTWCEPREPLRILNGEPGNDSDAYRRAQSREGKNRKVRIVAVAALLRISRNFLAEDFLLFGIIQRDLLLLSWRWNCAHLMKKSDVFIQWLWHVW